MRWPPRRLLLLFTVFLVTILVWNRRRLRDHRTKDTVRKSDTNYTIRNPEEFIGKFRDRNVFYNRVGKCGSRSLMKIVKQLRWRNEFRLKFSEETDRERPEIFEAVQEMMSVNTFVPPTFYNRHIHYLDFRQYQLRQPVYINMIRDPIERFASHYNFLKYGDGSNEIKSGSKTDWPDINECVMKDIGVCASNMMFYMGMYFCGLNDPVCENMNAPRRVGIAMRHIDEEYLFIGLMEEFETSLLLLEAVLPDYFSGALDVWIKIGQETRADTATKTKDYLSMESKEKLRTKTMVDEYKVYNHAKSKFNRMKTKYLMTR